MILEWRDGLVCSFDSIFYTPVALHIVDAEVVLLPVGCEKARCTSPLPYNLTLFLTQHTLHF